ncbi:sugar ABC transporter substrate-binding protein [Chelativorans sp. J32]|uniref:sugar ABC transporter substrate-binding protein n=1 Tax=Chelativorans sp. J32 TaxID=935840 RepID=UPI0004817FBA|nr:sugar ABC transporter substrate-binding protein [Chelativorans sp. J32]
MKKFLLGVAFSAVLTSSAFAQTIGVSMSELDNFLTILRNGIADYAKEKGVEVQIEVAEKDPAKQLSQIQNFIASGVDAIIVNPVDTDATAAQSKIAADAGIPLVYVNRQPANLDSLPDNQTFVGSNEVDSGTLETKEVCRLLKEKGKGDGANIVVLMGQLNNQAARQRTQDIHDVIATDECSFMKIVEEQTANWYRTEATDLMNNWLSAGVEFDAVVSNNDEMALGAIQAMKAAGMSMEDVVVGGVDATPDALAAMKAGDLDVTVFQNAAAQGSGAVDAALKLSQGEKLGNVVWVPFELVTPENMDKYMGQN